MIVYTDWFPAHITPVRPGLYQIQIGSGMVLGLWNGYDWHKPKCAFGELMTRSTYIAGRTGPAYVWRGITEESHKWLKDSLQTKTRSSRASTRSLKISMKFAQVIGSSSSKGRSGPSMKWISMD